MNIIQRATAPTPKFFRVLRLAALALMALAGIVSRNHDLPTELSGILDCIMSAGAAVTLVSQTTVDEKALAAERKKKTGNGK